MGNGFAILTLIEVSIGSNIPKAQVINQDNNEIRFFLCLYRFLNFFV